MNFLEDIFAALDAAGDQVILRELRADGALDVSGRELLRRIGQARAFLSRKGLKAGDRCGLLAHNGVDWVALDLAIMAERLIVVPLYARQSPVELVGMLKDCSPELIVCGDESLREGIAANWKDAPAMFLAKDIFAGRDAGLMGKPAVADSDAVAIIYTSGTSGEPKGAVITASNVAHILRCTSERLDALMAGSAGQDRVFQWAPLCFAAAWITMMTGLLRRSLISMNTDLSKLAGEIRGVAPDYFVNVPALLERVRRAVDEQLWKTGGFPLTVYSRAKSGWMRKQEGKSSLVDGMWLALANALVFPTIRKKMIGRNLKALICGSAPLNVETQLYFMMLGIPVLQVYGLTETTAICTMDDPRQVAPGRVGSAIPGVEMKLAENSEILVRGPNIFAGYWNRPQETAKVLREGWFHTGDQGEVDAAGRWKIVGRIKNLIIPASGINISPEPIEDAILQQLPDAQQVVLVGNGRSYLSAIITGPVTAEKAQASLDAVNPGLPHYKQVRNFCLYPEAFSIEDGLLTANGKLKRDAITERLREQIEDLYQVKQAV
jgi:long-chain acyl-CoA synthetase